MANLVEAMKALYTNEINCGIESFWDGGFTAWIGDDMNGRKAEMGFDVKDLGKAALWFLETARELYPKFQQPTKGSQVMSFVQLDDGRIAEEVGIPNNAFSKHYYSTYDWGTVQLLLPNMCKVVRKATRGEYDAFISTLRTALTVAWLCSPTGRVLK